MDEALKKFFSDDDQQIFCISGKQNKKVLPTVATYVQGRDGLHLVPTRHRIYNNKHLKTLSFAQFIKNDMIADIEHKHKHFYYIIIDDFHVETPEKIMVLLAIAKKYVLFEKLIVLSSTLSKYHVEMLESLTHDPKNNVVYFRMYPQHVPEVIYVDKLVTEDMLMPWVFDPHTYIMTDIMSQMIQQIMLEKDIREDSRRILIFVQSADVCEAIARDLEEWSSYSVATVYGQKYNSEIVEICNSDTKVIVSTNILENGFTVNDVGLIIDFGIVYSVNRYGFVSLRYCSKSELFNRNQLIDRHRSGKVVRVMTESFFMSCPIIEIPMFHWDKIIFEMILKKGYIFVMDIISYPSDNPIISKFGDDMVASIYTLSKYHLIDSEFNITSMLAKYKHLIPFLISSAFHEKHYMVITHLYHIHQQRSLPQITVLLATLNISLIDTIISYGKHKLFYFTTHHNHSTSQLLSMWLKIIFSYDETEDNRRLMHDNSLFMSNNSNSYTILFEMILTVIMNHCDNSIRKFFHINHRTLAQFIHRWKLLCSHVFFNIIPNSDTLSNKQFIDKVQKMLSYDPSYLNTVQLYLRPCIHPYRLLPINTIHYGSWYYMSNHIANDYYKVMWKLIDHSSWHDNVLPMNRKFYYNDDMIEEPKIVIDVEHQIYLPIPEDIRQHMSNLKMNIAQQSASFQECIESKKEVETYFKNAVVDQIENEVAYRPNMAKYFDVMQDFYSLRALI